MSRRSSKPPFHPTPHFAVSRPVCWIAVYFVFPLSYSFFLFSLFNLLALVNIAGTPVPCCNAFAPRLLDPCDVATAFREGDRQLV